jgi:tRNA 2-thiocytidine biosynthesis protein TtcA
MKRIVGQTRKALEDYHMIQAGDKITVGISGGKDSLTLLLALHELQKYYPKPFELCGISLDMGFEDADYTPIQKMCADLSIPYYVKKTNIKEIVFDIRKEKNPCALCANLRRGALNRAALEIGSNKIALGHHFDDVIETFMLSLFYEGRIHCFSPVTFLDRMQVYLIRPFIYVSEHSIRSAAKRLGLPVMHNDCPANGNTKRQYIKDLLTHLEKQDRNLKTRLFGAIQRSQIPEWAVAQQETPGNFEIVKNIFPAADNPANDQ